MRLVPMSAVFLILFDIYEIYYYSFRSKCHHSVINLQIQAQDASISLINASNKSKCELQNFYNRNQAMEIEQQRSLPLQLAIKYYTKWDCDIETQLQNSIYYKYLTGIGHVEFVNGNQYRGHFQKGLMQGKGIYTWQNGLRYEGNFENNAPNGQGKLIWPDGSRYNGEVVYGKRSGQGEYFCSKDSSHYKGSWKDGLKQGKGTLTFSNGAVYEGDFKNGLREGFGKMRYPSGNEYEGSWKADKKEGRGMMSWFSSHEKYDGEWKKDVPEGVGTYFWFQNKAQTKTIKTVYKGEWKNGKRQGIGAFYYNNGCRLQGTFMANLKEGLCVITDQFGETFIQHFKHDKSCSKQAHRENTLAVPQTNAPVIHNNDPAENTYIKMIDIKSPLLDEAIFNLLLRSNSELRNDYRTLITAANKQIFNGLNIQGLWKLVRDMKVTDETITLATLNRRFYSGLKSKFQIVVPSKQKMKILRDNPKVLARHNYQDLEWDVAFEQFKKIELDWDNWSSQILPQVDLKTVSLKDPTDIHNQDHVILYRHFIVYLIHLTILQYEQRSLAGETVSFRKCLEDILYTAKIAATQSNSSASNKLLSLKTMKVCSQVNTNLSHNQQKLAIPQEYSSINHQLIDQLNANRANLLNVIDKTVSVKQLYCLLCQCGILKEATEKMLFLQRIERTMNVKSSLLKKDNKNNYSAFQKIVLSSPHFSHIINYQMIPSELDEILFKLLNRKIGNTHSKEEFLKKYKETVKNLVTQVIRQREQVSKEKRTVKFKFNRISSKDRQREALLRRLEEEKRRRAELERKERELKMEARQRELMRREDRDVQDDLESENSEQYYD